MKAKHVIRRPRGQRVESVCDNPACGRTFSRERSTSNLGQYTYCCRSCKSLSPYRAKKGEYVRSARGSSGKLTPWFSVTTDLPVRAGLYRAQTKDMPPEVYIDAWWERGRWWVYDDAKRECHISLTPLTNLVRWRGRTVAPDPR